MPLSPEATFFFQNVDAAVLDLVEDADHVENAERLYQTAQDTLDRILDVNGELSVSKLAYLLALLASHSNDGYQIAASAYSLAALVGDTVFGDSE